MRKIHRLQFHQDVIERMVASRKLPLPRKGERYGKLTVTGDLAYVRSGINRLMISCRCDCGADPYYPYVQTLTGGKAVSCGCAPKGFIHRVETPVQDRPLYSTWCNMRARCRNPRLKSYKWYGGRGIRVCQEWQKDFWAFEDWSMRNGWKPGLSIDRIDFNGNYEPGNCRWTTSDVQARNTSQNVHVSAFGETRVLIDWTSDPRCVVDHHVLAWRLKQGYEPERAITQSPFRGVDFTAFGETKPLSEWASDPRCVVAISTLRERTKASRKMSFEEALTRPAASKPVPGREIARQKRRAKNAEKRAVRLHAHL